MKKEQFSALVKLKSKQVAFQSLLKEKETKSKIKNIKYQSLKIQNYLMSNQISLRQKKLIFKLRTRMVATSDNFGLKIPCKVCFLGEDNISHVLDCILLKLEIPEILSNVNRGPNDVFDTDMSKVKQYAALFEKAWRKREEVID